METIPELLIFELHEDPDIGIKKLPKNFERNSTIKLYLTNKIIATKHGYFYLTPKGLNFTAKNSQLFSKLKQLRQLVEVKFESMKISSELQLEQENKVNIKRLHLLNETKDLAEIIIGKIAEFQCKSLKEVYEDYELS